MVYSAKNTCFVSSRDMGGNRAPHTAGARALSPVLSKKELTHFEMLKTSAWEDEKGKTCVSNFIGGQP